MSGLYAIALYLAKGRAPTMVARPGDIADEIDGNISEIHGGRWQACGGGTCEHLSGQTLASTDLRVVASRALSATTIIVHASDRLPVRLVQIT